MPALQFEQIGTQWEIECDDLGSDGVQKIHTYAEWFDAQFSRFRDGSLIEKLASSPGTYTVPEDLVTMLLLYLPVESLTGGRVTPTIGDLLVTLGYDKTYTFVEKDHSAKRPLIPLTQALSIEDSQTITIHHPVMLDLGALGKGYLIDQLAHLLDRHTPQDSSYTINAGGDIRHSGTKPLTVGLEHPADSTKLLGTVPVHNGAIAASAGNRRQWNKYHHLVDPKTKRPVDSVIASWVLCEEATRADLLATALFFCSPEHLQHQYQFEGVVIYRDRIWISEGFPGEVYTRR